MYVLAPELQHSDLSIKKFFLAGARKDNNIKLKK